MTVKAKTKKRRQRRIWMHVGPDGINSTHTSRKDAFDKQKDLACDCKIVSIVLPRKKSGKFYG